MTDRSMTPREVFQRKQERVLELDMHGQAELFAADGVMEFPFAPPPMPRRLQGRDEIRDVLTAAVAGVRQAGVRMTGFDSAILHVTTDPEVIIAEFELCVHHVATGNPVRLPYIQVLRIRDGEIVSFRDYFSIAAAAAVFGPEAHELLGSVATPAVSHDS